MATPKTAWVRAWLGLTGALVLPALATLGYLAGYDLLAVAAFLAALLFVVAKTFSGKDGALTAGIFSVYFMCIIGVTISAFYRLKMGDSFQNESDPFGFYTRTEIADQPLILPSWNENSYEMRAATGIWILANRIFSALGIPYRPEVATLVSSFFAAITAGMAARIAALWNRHKGPQASLDAQYKTMAGFSLSGLILAGTCIQLRDIYGCFYFTACAWAWSAWQDQRFGAAKGASLLLALVVTLLTSLALALIRPEMAVLPGLFLAISLVGRWSMRAILAALGASALLIMLFGKLYFGVATTDLIKERASSYTDLASDISPGFSQLIYNASLPVKIVLGPWYTSMYPIPIFAGFEGGDSYGLFRSMNPLWMMIGTPVVLAAFWKACLPEGRTYFANMLNARVGLVFILLLLLLVGITSVEARHLIPAIGIWAALLCSLEWRKDSLMRGFTLLWTLMVFGVNIAWMVIKS